MTAACVTLHRLLLYDNPIAVTGIFQPRQHLTFLCSLLIHILRLHTTILAFGGKFAFVIPDFTSTTSAKALFLFPILLLETMPTWAQRASHQKGTQVYVAI